MSSQHTSSNNQGPVPANYIQEVYTRDPTCYHKDGSVVFLVEGVLFKFQGSLILQPDSISPGKSPNSSIQRYPKGIDNLPSDLTSSSDENPIDIPNVQAGQFRNFLFAVIGRPFDPEYRALMVAAEDKNQHNQNLLVRYLDISCLARQFGVTELEHWARSQLCLVLESMYDLALDSWDDKTLLRIDSYARSTAESSCMNLADTFIQYFISISVDRKTGQSPSPTSSNLDTCIRLYKNPFLPHKNPALFGCVFMAILSLGPKSDVWDQSLTQMDRIVLYAAQVRLTSASSELKNVSWLQSLSTSPLATADACAGCWYRLYDLWKESFGNCAGLKSEEALKDVTELARLPQYRKTFLSRPRWETQAGFDPNAFAFRTLLFVYRGAKSSPPHGPKCPELNTAIVQIDRSVKVAYEELARRHYGFKLEAQVTS